MALPPSHGPCPHLQHLRQVLKALCRKHRGQQEVQKVLQLRQVCRAEGALVEVQG